MISAGQHTRLYIEFESLLRGFDVSMSDSEIAYALVDFCESRNFEVRAGKFDANGYSPFSSDNVRRFYINFESSVDALTFAWDCHLKSIGRSGVLIEAVSG